MKTVRPVPELMEEEEEEEVNMRLLDWRRKLMPEDILTSE